MVVNFDEVSSEPNDKQTVGQPCLMAHCFILKSNSALISGHFSHVSPV